MRLRADEFVAQVKFTALLLPSGNCARLTAGPVPNATSEMSVQDAELVELLAQVAHENSRFKAYLRVCCSRA